MQLIPQLEELSGACALESHSPERAQAEYLAMVCHEISTPLASIIGLSRILSDEASSLQRRKECAEMLTDSANMLMELMKNVLDHSRAGSGTIELETIDFDPAKVAREAVRIVAARAREKGLDLQVRIGRGLPSNYIGDPLRIRQILLNLLSNAVKFTQKGRIRLYAYAKCDSSGNDQLCITVADTGIGVSEEAIGKIFGKYSQAHSGISREYGGTGLGLSISQELARLMHGKIVVKSWPGKGSHFIVTLPLQKMPAMLASA